MPTLCKESTQHRQYPLACRFDADLRCFLNFFHLYVVRTKVSQQTVVDSITGSAVLQLILVYLPLVVMFVYVVASVLKRRCGSRSNRQVSSDGSTKTLYRMMINLVTPHYSSRESVCMDEFPHRMIANDVDYEEF